MNQQQPGDWAIETIACRNGGLTTASCNPTTRGRGNGPRRASALLPLLLLAALGVADGAQNINIGPAELLRTDAQLPFTFDGSCATLRKDAATWYFFQTSDWARELRRYSGTVDDPFKTREPNFSINDNGYGGGMWILNLYKIDDTNLLGFVHRETIINNPNTEYRIGLAKSTDGGSAWTYLGDVIAPEDRLGNIGGVPYLVVGEYFYVYFNEYPASGLKRLSVARAKVSDTLAAFETNAVPEFAKYNNGSWDQDGMTGLASHIVPISMDMDDWKEPDFHSDAAYCKPLGKYLITANTWRTGQLLLFSSTNGVDWGEQTLIDENPATLFSQAYSFFLGNDGASDDGREVGSNFSIYFPRKDWPPARYDYDEFYRCHVTVNAAPTCSIMSPTNGATYPAPASVPISADAADTDGTVTQVEFFQGAVKIGESTTSPYGWAWNGVGGGTYSLTARATDNQGAMTTSAVVTVTVTGTPDEAPTVATVAAASPNPVTGATANVSVLGADDGGETNLIYTWAAAGLPPAAVAFSPNGNHAARNSMATFTQAGSYILQTEIRDAVGAAATSTVGVTVSQTLTSIAVSPANATVTTNTTQAFAASARDQFGTVLSSQPSFVWTASAGGTIDASGLFTAGSTTGGPYTVTAASGSVTGTASVTVTSSVEWEMAITFSGYTRAEALTNFPALVVLSNNVADSGFAYSQMASSQGWDLRFKDAGATTNLNYEVEMWDTNGASVVWVQVPVLTNNAKIMAYWGDDNLTSAPPAYTTNGATWSSEYLVVHHLAHTNGTTAYDSTVNGYNGALQNMAGTEWTAGPIANGLSMGSDDYYTLPNISSEFGNSATLMFWAKLNDSGGGRGFAWLDSCGNSSHYPWDANAYIGTWRNARAVWAVGSFDRTAWHLVTVTSETGGSTKWRFYQNATIAYETDATAFTVPTTPNIGGAGYSGHYINGLVDEVRISAVARSSNWIYACWMNQASNTTFASYGPAQEAGSGVDAYGIPDAWKIQYFQSTTGPNTGGLDDWDQDGQNNLEEYISGTIPTNALSLFKIELLTMPGVAEVWLDGASGRVYGVYCRDDLLTGQWLPLNTNINGTGNPIVYIDTTAGWRRFYRLKVTLP